MKLELVAVARALAASAVFVTSPVSAATIIDFQTLEVADTQIHARGDVYTDDGFTLTEAGVFQFGSFGTLAFFYPGSTTLFSNTAGGLTTLTRTAGGTFSLSSIDLAPLNGPGALRSHSVASCRGEERCRRALR